MVDAYEGLTSQYIEQFILGSESEDKLLRLRDVLLVKMEAIASGDKTQILLARHLEKELMGEEQEEEDFDKVVAIVESSRGVPVNQKEMSVKMFYTHFNILLENGKKANKDKGLNTA